MHRILFFLILITHIKAQNPFFNDPVISGTPLIPSDEVILEYLNDLKAKDLNSFKKITSVTTLPQNVGDEHEFNVLDLQNINSPKLDKKLFVLKVVSEKVDIWVEKAELENNHVTDAVISQIYNGLMVSTPAQSINPQQGIYEIETDIYGLPPDIDQNGKVEFLLTDISDGWDGNGGFIGGFFYPNDQDLSFPGSNKADILYVDTFPGIYQDDKYDTHRALGSVAHELQHVVHYEYDQQESHWVNEGLSELASYLCGYGLRSPGLYLENPGLSMIAWNTEEALPHYSRVALWTYYLYEKYGLSLISEISQEPESGIDGFNNALNSAGLNLEFQDVLSDFFKILSSNDPLLNNEYAFELPEFQYLKIVPKYRIIDYPLKKEFIVGSYSMQAAEFTNGDSLSIHFENMFKYPVYISKLGFGEQTLLNEYDSEYIFDNHFGVSHHTQNIYFFNPSPSSDLVKFKTDSKIKYDIIELQYDSDMPTYSISSFNSSLKGTTNGIQYSSPRDTAILKSIKFYNKSAHTDLRIHLFQTPLREGRNPSSDSFIKKNVVLNEWISIDTEDFLLTKDENESFDVGIEFLTDGAGVMGYQNLTGSNHENRSFIKGLTNQTTFFNLSQYQVAGTSLDGTWMIRLEIAAPYSGSQTQPESRIESLSTFPIPFDPTQNPGLCTIEYELDNFGPVELKIYNILGQLVFSDFDELGGGAFYWDGSNFLGYAVASGFYIISLATKKNKIYKRLLLIR